MIRRILMILLAPPAIIISGVMLVFVLIASFVRWLVFGTAEEFMFFWTGIAFIPMDIVLIKVGGLNGE